MPFFAARETRILTQVRPQAQAADVNQSLVQWPGPPATFATLWQPKLRGQGVNGQPFEGWASVPWLYFRRADTRQLLLTRQQNAVVMDARFAGGNELQGIPGVFVPTSLANGYSSRSSI